MKIENMKIKDIIPYEKNAKKHNRKQIQNVAESIKRFGFAQPLVVDKDNVLIIGHCRLLASKLLQIREVPVVRMDDLTEEQVKELRLLDNKLNESDWDMELLAEELQGLDLEGFDIEWDLPEEEPEPEIIEAEVPEEVEPICKAGEIWKLGEHRLICGDSTNGADIARLMNGEKADMLLTDPPYNVNYKSKAGKIQNDNMSDAAFKAFLVDAFTTANDNMKAGAAFYIWHADGKSYNFHTACREIGWEVRQCLIWVKNMFTLGRQDYQWQHEPCLYGWKAGGAHYFIDKRNLTTIIEDEIDLDKMKKEDMKKLLEQLFRDDIPKTILRADKPAHSDLHPTMKPLKLMAKQINNSSRKNEIVLDIFGGSGSTLMAAEQLGRRCYTCELDPHYASVIITRWQDFTGRTAEKIDG